MTRALSATLRDVRYACRTFARQPALAAVAVLSLGPDELVLVRSIIVLVGIGLAIGIPLAFVAGRQCTSVLYGLESSSVSTLLSAAALLAAVAILAAALPATRATRVDPLTALRDQ